MKRLCAIALVLLAPPAAAAADDAADWWRVFARKSGSYAVETRHYDRERRPRFINALINEDSPYLLQHAHNPVAWNAWGDDALARARRSNRLIFLSIGYSTCHWCRVMARESFDSERIADLLNGEYVSIKVDREERPDLDEYFLARLELLSNSPGWPMTLVLTPAGELFAAESYMAEEALAAHLRRLAKAWKERPQNVKRLAATIAAKFSALPAEHPRAAESRAWYERAIQTVRQQYDEVHHGFGKAPKFPNAPHLLSLLDAFSRNAEQGDRNKFLATLRAMAASALHDPIEGGFFRYSLTGDWQTPHFEKVLTDQALLARLFAEAWGITGEQEFARASAATLEFVNHRLRRSDGLFFSAIDADSQGRPGAYYLWREADLAAALPARDRAAVAQHFRSVPQPGGGMLLLPQPGVAGPAFDAALATLAALRTQRPAPFIDSKVITGWNALMVEALARCGDLLREARYVSQAGLVMQSLLKLHVNDELIARYSVGQQVHGTAALEDAANLLSALAALYDVEGDAKWHDHARRLLPRVAAPPPGDTVQLRLFARDRELPAATAVLMRALHRLFLQSGDAKFRDALQAITPVAANILAVDGVADRASLAGALHEIGHPLPQRGAFLARGHIRAELAGARPERDSGKAAFALTLRIDPGWHVNSHRPLQDYLIPVAVDAAAGQQLSITYPAGKTVRLGFEDSPVSVYEESVTINGQIEARPDADALSPPLKLTLQACTDKSCLPPESVLLHYLFR